MTRSLSPENYREFCEFLESACGILLGTGKEYLVSSRLRPVLDKNRIDSFDDLLKRLNSFAGRDIKLQVIDAMTTNETLWFRDSHPFVFLKEKLAAELVAKAKGRPVRIWSAACSSGQEPYSLSICLEELGKTSFALQNAKFEIIATDIAPSVLEQAQKAEYDSLALSRGMSLERLKQHFEQVSGSEDRWRVKDNIKSRISFRSLNLQENYINLGGKVDLIFCRNVLIYFSPENKRKILEKMHQQLNPGGVLILGASESIGMAGDIYKMEHYSNGLMYVAK